MNLQTRINRLELVPTPLRPVSRVTLRTTEDVVTLLEQTANGLRSGEIDVPTANALGGLASHALKALEQLEVTDRIAGLERVLEPERQRMLPKRR